MIFPFVLISSFASGIIAQAIKILLKMRKSKFQPELLDSYGGMPSAHSAFLFGLLTSVAIAEGFDSTAFGISAIMAAIMIRDALGFRMILEEHGVTLSKLAKAVKKQHPKIKNGKRYQIGHRVGHTIPEVIVGSAIGIMTAAFTWWVFVM